MEQKYKRAVVPLDGSEEAEAALRFLPDLLASDSEVVLVRVVPPAKTQVFEGYTILSSQQDEVEISRAEAYLRTAGLSLPGALAERCQYAAVINSSVTDAIVQVASEREADVIVMFTHNRKGLARIVKGSIARQVQKNTDKEVKLYNFDDIVSRIA
jgi:nucleotide-binding universal stress UspA family protein